MGWSINLNGDKDGEEDWLCVRVNASHDKTQIASLCDKEGVSDKEWHHVVMVIDRSEKELKAYLDGDATKFSSGGSGGKSASMAGFGAIGVKDNPMLGLGFGLDGDLDEFSAWSRALTEAEVKDLYTLGQRGESLKGALK
jgi:hypothetical protein